MEYFVEPLVLLIASGAKPISYHDKNNIFVNITQEIIEKESFDAHDNDVINII